MQKSEKLVIIVAVSLMTAVFLAIVSTIAIEGELSVKPLAVAVVCAVVISTPMAHFVLGQTEKLEAAYADMTAAHKKLSELYKQLEDAHLEMEFKAKHDGMTGLINRATFIAALEEGRRSSDRGFMLMIDADRFKRINDTYGHDTGDRVLVGIAEALRTTTRTGDFCARIGGEEFAVYLPGSTYRDAQKCAERLRLGVSEKKVEMSSGETISVTVSIGGAPFEAGQSVDDLMRVADSMLYRAKNEGRNRICIEAPISEAA